MQEEKHRALIKQIEIEELAATAEREIAWMSHVRRWNNREGPQDLTSVNDFRIHR